MSSGRLTNGAQCSSSLWTNRTTQRHWRTSWMGTEISLASEPASMYADKLPLLEMLASAVLCTLQVVIPISFNAHSLLCRQFSTCHKFCRVWSPTPETCRHLWSDHLAGETTTTSLLVEVISIFASVHRQALDFVAPWQSRLTWFVFKMHLHSHQNPE